MNLFMLLESNIQNVESMQNAIDATSKSNDYFGALITIICCIISGFITWKATLRTIEKKTFTYQINVFSLLSKPESVNMEGMKIEYKNKVLENPCFLTVDIMNTGNKSIDNPKITIGYEEDIRMMPAYLEDIPKGYEGDWKFDPSYTEQNSCRIILNHINAKKTVKARFFLDNYPKGQIYVTCPMNDLEIIEGNISTLMQNLRKNPLWKRFNLVLTIIVAFITYLYAGFGYFYWDRVLEYILWNNNMGIKPIHVYIYLLGMVALSLIINVFGENRLDLIRGQLGQKGILAEFIIFVVTCVGIVTMVYDLVPYAIQPIIAMIVILIHAFLLHRVWMLIFHYSNN